MFKSPEVHLHIKKIYEGGSGGWSVGRGEVGGIQGGAIIIPLGRLNFSRWTATTCSLR